MFLLLCLTAPFLGTYAWLQIEKRKVKKEIKWRIIDGMDKSELALLKFTKEKSESKLRWEHSREFEYDGQMYDVVESRSTGDTTYYYCWWDNEETILNLQLSELVAKAMGKNPLNKEKQERLSNFLKNLYCQVKPDNNSFQDTANGFFALQIQLDYSSICFSPPTPPPEIA